MLPNDLYDLMTQMVVENRSLWRIRSVYLADSAKCENCLAFWNKMIKDKEDHIQELTELIKRHMGAA